MLVDAPQLEVRARRELIPALDGLRGLAIVAVLLHHGALYFAPTGKLGAGVSALAAGGWGGVELFFVLSGFLITSILLAARGRPHAFRDFYARRVLRIFPLYYLFLFVLFVVLPGVVLGRPRPEHPALFWLYVQNLGPDFHGASFPPLAWGVTWSLAIEEQFYLLWPLAVLRLEPRQAGRLAATVGVLSFALRLGASAAGAGPVQLSTFTPFRLEGLALGACLAIWRPRLAAWRAAPTLARWIGALCALGLLALLLAPGGLSQKEPAVARFGPTLVSLAGGALLWLALAPGATANLLSLSPLRALGRHSYAMYLLHTPITWLLLRLPGFNLRDDAHALARLLAFWTLELAATFLASLVVWHAFEKWFLRQKVRFGGLPG